MSFVDKCILNLFSVLFICQVGFTQKSQVSGIINQYAPVHNIINKICGDTIILETPISVIKNDKLLIIQMQGASINTSNSSSFGQIQSLNNAGNFEVIKVDTIISNKIVIYQTLKNSYDTASKVQVVKIPTYENALVTNELRSLPWNGSIGGVLAIDVLDTLELISDIRNDGDGFRGGEVVFKTYTFSTSACGITDYFNPNGDMKGGEKGEGAAERKKAYQCGRGRLANGGGGGNSHNSGGAGGSNFGSGGIGGNQWEVCGSTNLGGLGGDSILYTTLKNKIFLGGGGGAGEANGARGSSGGNGGGIVFISANVFRSNGYTISSIGDSALTATADGSGGGGSGGSILLIVNKYLDSTNVVVAGGKGGDNNNAGSCVGTGGGGGGGVIWTQGSTTPPLLKFSYDGGESGKILNINHSNCYNTSYGAGSGNKGGVLNNLDVNLPNSNKSDLLGSDTVLCPNQTIILDVTASNANYLWQDNSINSTFTVTQSGLYWVEVSDNCNTLIDSISISYHNTLNINLGSDTVLCPNQSITLDATSSNATYLWQDNSTNSTFTVSQSGLFWVKVTDTCQTYFDSIFISYQQPINLNLGSDTILCPNQTITLDATAPNATYQWQDNSTNSTFDVIQSGNYWVEVTDICNKYTDSVLISYQQPINLNLGTDTILCPNQTLTLDATTLNATYRWQDNSTDSILLVNKSGVYWVEVDQNGCVYIDSISVKVYSILPKLLFDNDTLICANNSLTLDVTFPNSNYLWNGGTTFPILKVSQSGIYWVRVSNNCSISSDTIRVDVIDCNCQLYLPNVFTPNDDKVNDILLPKSIEGSLSSNCEYKNYNLSIFNRWGEKIFESNGIGLGWDGRSRGKLVNSGVYAYTIQYKLNDVLKKLSGSFIVLK